MRTEALKLLDPATEPDALEALLATDERLAFMDLAAELGWLASDLAARMTAREWTQYRARGLVKYAQEQARKVIRDAQGSRGDPAL